MSWLRDKAEQFHVWITLFISIGAIAGVTGFTFSPPWPAKSTITEIGTKLDGISKQQRILEMAQMPLIRDYWESRRALAKRELTAHPDSMLAASQLETAERELKRLDRRERLLDEPGR